MSESQGSTADRIARLQDQFRQLIPARIQELQDLWHGFGKNPDQELLLELHRKVHSLAGSAGSFGAPAVSKKARILELALRPGIAEQRGFSPVEYEYISRALQALEELAGLEFDRNALLTDPRLTPLEPDNRLVYLIADEAGLDDAIAAQLEYKGLIPRIFNSTESFVTALRRQRPSVVIVDTDFAGCDAAARLIESLRDDGDGSLPVLFLSTRGDFQARLQALRLGIGRYLVKPTEAGEVAEATLSLLSEGIIEDYRILIVDDDADLADYHATILSDAGMEVEVIADPTSALEVISRFHPELVLMDVYMSGCSGLELAAILRQDHDLAMMPIIFLSTEERIEQQLSALNLGGDDFLAKPVLPAHLLQAVTARLKRARTLMRLNDGLDNAFRESSALRNAMEMHNLVSVTDLDGVITYANDKFCQVSGYDRQELIGQNHRIVNSGYHDKTFFSHLWNTIAQGDIWRGTLCNRDKNGQYYWVESTIIPLLDDEGLPREYVSIRTDVTGLKQAEQVIASKRALLNLVRNGLTRLVSHSGIEGVAEYLLRGLLSISGSEAGFLAEVEGFDRDEVPLRTHAFLGVDDATTARWRRGTHNSISGLPGFREMVDRVRRSGQPEYRNRADSECSITGSDAAAEGIEINNYACVPVWYGHEMVGLFGLYNHHGGFDEQDVEFLQPFSASYGVVIHHRRAQQREDNVREQLIIAKESAEQASRMKSDFLSGVSHELRTPLNSIIGFGQLMESDPEHPLIGEQAENLGEILSAGRHLLSLIDEILDLAKIEAGRLDLQMEQIAVAEVLQEALSLMRPLARKQGVSMHCDLNSLRDLKLEADRTRLRQVLINLVSNAIKYNRQGGSVTISGGRTEDGGIAVEVSDTGIGMSQRELADLFIPFHRPGSSSHSVEGTGIGLVLSRNLVERMGGIMEVSSRPGVGTCFTISFHD